MNRTEELLEQILDSAHPKLADSMRMAAVPHWYDAGLFQAIRHVFDGKNDGYIERLQNVSFILPVPTGMEPTYRVRDEERILLNIDWINRDLIAYLTAHRRAFDYYQGHHADTDKHHLRIDSVTSSLIEEYPHLYHQFFVDLPSANRALILLFRNLYKDRKLGAIDSLLDMLGEVHAFLHLIVANDKARSSGEQSRGDGGTADASDDGGGEQDGGEQDGGEQDGGEQDGGEQQDKDGEPPPQYDDGNAATPAEEKSTDKESARNNDARTNDARTNDARNDATGAVAMVPIASGQATTEPEGEPSLTISVPTAADLQQFDTLQAHYIARSLQLRGNWDESLEQARALRLSPELAKNLAPYVIRSYGKALANTGQHVDGIYQLQEALNQFKKLPPDPLEPWHTEVEQAYTMIDLGEAYVALAQEVRGFAVSDTADSSTWERIRDAAGLLLNGPLVVYLSRFLGRRVWSPSFWPTLRHLDWVIARLFARAVELYERADVILERTHLMDEHVIADEKLAFLYIAMGDAEQAHHHFKILQDDTAFQLSDYRRARLAVGDAWTHVQRQQYEEAIALLEPSLPILATSEDDEIVTLTHSLLAEAYIATDDPDAAIDSVKHSLENMTARNAEAGATNLIERLELLLDQASLEEKNWVDNARTQLKEKTAIVKRRVYDVGFHHPLLRYFRQFVALLVPGAIVLGLLITLNLETRLDLSPELMVKVAPLLNPLEVASTQLSQGITSTEPKFEPDAEAGILFGLLFLGGFMALSLLVGLIAIQRANLRELEKHQKQTVTIEDEAISVGPPGAPIRIPQREIQRIVKGDVRLWQSPMPAHSNTALQSKEYSAIIPGSTNWYERITQRLGGTNLPDVDERNLSFSLLRSGPGILYGLNLLLLTLILLIALSNWQELKELLWVDLFGTSYSVADGFPYLFLGTALVPTWWTILRPLQVGLEIGYISRIPWIVLGAGSLFTLILAITRFKPLFTAPDIYPVVVIVPSVLVAAWVIWHFRDGEALYYQQHERIGAVLLAVFISILLVGAVQRDVRSYHYLIMGNTARSQNTVQGNNRAITHYQKAVEIGRQKKWWLFDPVAAFRPTTWPPDAIGLPTRENIPWFSAQKSLAALQSDFGGAKATAAVKNYTQIIDALGCNEAELIDCEKDDANFFAWRAMAQARVSTIEGQGGEISTEDYPYAKAARDFERAIAIDESRPEFHTWAGFTYQSLGKYEEADSAYDNAILLNEGDIDFQRKVNNLKGWVAYGQEEFELAIDYFSSSILTSTVIEDGNQIRRVVVDDLQRDALKGQGHANYFLGRQLYKSYDDTGENPPAAEMEKIKQYYDDAADAWDQIGGSISNLEVFKSQATLHWAKAGVAKLEGDDLTKCQEWETARDIFDRSARPAPPSQTERERAFTYRSLAQTEWLLRGCTTTAESRSQWTKRAIDSYTEAIKYSGASSVNADEDVFYEYYIQMRGRIGYVLWLELSEQAASESNTAAIRHEVLIDAMQDLQTALELDPVDAFIGNEGKTDARTQFDYIPNDFTHKNVLPTAFAELRKATDEGEGAFAEELVEAILGLSAALDGTDQPLTACEHTPLSELGSSYSDSADSATNSATNRALPIDGLNRTPFEEPLMELVHAHFLLEQGDLNSARGLFADLVVDEPYVGYQALIAARHAAALSLASADPQQAGCWYAQVLRTAGESSYDTAVYSAARGDMGRIWSTSQVPNTVAELLSSLSEHLALDAAAYPKLADVGIYWNRRAWFQYTVGQEAFRRGDEATARQALTLAQPDADRAADLGVNGGDVVDTYLVEGAWGWYHMVRGNDAFADGRYAAALSDYTKAYAAFKPETNLTAQDEHVDSALNAGFTSLMINRHQDATSWYINALERAEGYPEIAAESRSNVAEEIERLENTTINNRTTSTVRDGIVRVLRTWLEEP